MLDFRLISEVSYIVRAFDSFITKISAFWKNDKDQNSTAFSASLTALD